MYKIKMVGVGKFPHTFITKFFSKKF